MTLSPSGHGYELLTRTLMRTPSDTRGEIQRLPAATVAVVGAAVATFIATMALIYYLDLYWFKLPLPLLRLRATPEWDLVMSLIRFVPFAVLAVGVGIIAPTTRRRILAVVLVLVAAAATQIALPSVAAPAPLVMIIAAWGVVRRSGSAWLAALPMAYLIIWTFSFAWNSMLERIELTRSDAYPWFLAYSTIAVAIVAASGIGAWLLELVQRRSAKNPEPESR
ncbi:hypothetical protein [Nocardioides sp. NPDC006273]|uniref:hypothetical protein n=1 Tax=Nocardioides sp. NPDC006273 TaxID=3155598 RepID=UPI0033B583F7